MASTNSTQQREQPVGTESETPGRETSLNEQPAGTGPVEAPSIGGATNENNNGEREARPAKKKKKSKKSKAEKRLARFKTCCSLLNRKRMIRAEQQRIYLIERNKINDLREKFVIVGPAGNVYTVTIAHLPDCNCPDFMKGFLCKHIFFVYLKVLGVNRDSTLIYQKALLSKELRSIFTSNTVLHIIFLMYNVFFLSIFLYCVLSVEGYHFRIIFILPIRWNHFTHSINIIKCSVQKR
ncbi:unnamed protein product [Rhizophagus irregularis]|nr:unnamed protein product [Rhizophagus irregularis]